MSKNKQKSLPFPFLAMFLAWLVPGAGHVYIGRLGRGVVLFVVISATFWAGVAMGGVMTVDHRREGWWFFAQLCGGVHGLVGWRRQVQLRRRLGADEGIGDAPTTAARQAYMDRKLAREGLALVAPTETVARAYAGVAGLLNLLCVFDATVLAFAAAGGKTGAGQAGRPPRREAGP